MEQIKTIQELHAELAKHRKLLHRAVGNQILPEINYHHYHVVKIIDEINDVEFHKKRLAVDGIFDKDIKALGADFSKLLAEQFRKLEDQAILKGK